MQFNLESGKAILERTPSVLCALLQDLPSEWITANEGPETWSPYDIIGHLIHGEKTDWITRCRIILDQGDDRRFAPFDRFAQFRESEGKTINSLLDEFAHLRRRNLQTLADWKIQPHHLDLTAIHPALGTVNLHQLLSTWVAHDLSHLAQITRVMAKGYKDDVGPWRQYLTVMEH